MSNPATRPNQHPDPTGEIHRQLLAYGEKKGKPSALVIQAMIDQAADVNAPDAEGYPPLLRLLMTGVGVLDTQYSPTWHVCLSALLMAGADLNVTLRDGTTPYDLAKGWPFDNSAHDKLVCEAYRRAHPDLMREVPVIDIYWPKPGTAVDDALKGIFTEACDKLEVDKVKYMLHLYPEAVHWRDNDGWTGLQTALYLGDNGRELAEVLIKHGADVNLRDDDSMTPLMMVALKGTALRTLIPPLILAGADATLRDKDGETAMDIAKRLNPSVAGVLQTVLDTYAQAQKITADYESERKAAAASTLQQKLAADPRRLQLKLKPGRKS